MLNTPESNFTASKHVRRRGYWVRISGKFPWRLKICKKYFLVFDRLFISAVFCCNRLFLEHFCLGEKKETKKFLKLLALKLGSDFGKLNLLYIPLLIAFVNTRWILIENRVICNEIVIDCWNNAESSRKPPAENTATVCAKHIFHKPVAAIIGMIDRARYKSAGKKAFCFVSCLAVLIPLKWTTQNCSFFCKIHRKAARTTLRHFSK